MWIVVYHFSTILSHFFFYFLIFILSHGSYLLIYFEIINIRQYQLRLTRASRDHLMKSLWSEQGHLEQVALDCVQSNFEYLQGWRFHIISWQPVPVSDHLIPRLLTNIVRVNILFTSCYLIPCPLTNTGSTGRVPPTFSQITIPLMEPRGGVILSYTHSKGVCMVGCCCQMPRPLQVSLAACQSHGIAYIPVFATSDGVSHHMDTWLLIFLTDFVKFLHNTLSDSITVWTTAPSQWTEGPRLRWRRCRCRLQVVLVRDIKAYKVPPGCVKSLV